MQERIARRKIFVATVSAFVLSCSFATRVAAHPSAALPPIWDPGPCIEVIDRDAEEFAHFSYRVEMDDTMLTTGDIALPDAMTHQFFAFRGQIVFEGFVPEVWSFDPEGPDLVPMPLWITRGDVTRAQASSDATSLGYDLSEVTPETTLETMSVLSNRWLRVTSDDARRPITLDQALLGVDWRMKDVTPGLYTLAGYIFSPPYNGWEVRKVLVKVKDASSDPAAAVVQRVQESLFAGQGRRVHACLDVPAGTRLRTFAAASDQPDAEWKEWGSEEEVSSGEIERCFVPNDSALAGSLRFRFDLASPDGQTQSFYSPDTLVILGGSVPCSPSDTICCPAADGGGKDAGVDAASEMEPDAEVKPRARESGGCSVTQPRSGGGSVALLSLAAALCSLRRGRRLQKDRHAE